MGIIDTHIHIDGPEFDDDRQEVITRAREAGVSRMLVPAIDSKTSRGILTLASQYPRYLLPMVGLHPEEVKDDWQSQLSEIEALITEEVIAIGEIGLDYYWSREYEAQQLAAFEAQVQMAIRHQLPLMVHCRKAQNEMVAILKRYKEKLCGGVFHCFTGSIQEAHELLAFDGFALGIGGVLTFKKSKLPETLAGIPLERIVLETDAPYMAPVPLRGKRNESAFLTHVIEKLSDVYATTPAHLVATTSRTATTIFRL